MIGDVSSFETLWFSEKTKYITIHPTEFHFLKYNLNTT